MSGTTVFAKLISAINATMNLSAIPTNIITGFLGVGKTTAILHLLRQKPADECWAVLVNEFGEVGIDGGLFTGAKYKAQDVFIREVPGGCMCCAAGLPMQVALNVLLAEAKPQRLLIEPTGLGHPVEVMEVLSAEYYRDVLNLNHTLTLVDARKISNKRYTDHDTFNQQLDIADVIVASKSDQYGDQDLSKLVDYLKKRHGDKVKPIYPVNQGRIKMAWLEGIASASRKSSHHHHPVSAPDTAAIPQQYIIPECGYLSITNKGDGFASQGWIFEPDFVFDRQKLNSLLLGIEVERAKAIFITHDGVVGFNKVDDVLTEIPLDDSMDSRIELISDSPDVFEGLEQALLDCI